LLRSRDCAVEQPDASSHDLRACILPKYRYLQHLSLFVPPGALQSQSVRDDRLLTRNNPILQSPIRPRPLCWSPSTVRTAPKHSPWPTPLRWAVRTASATAAGKGPSTSPSLASCQTEAGPATPVLGSLRLDRAQGVTSLSVSCIEASPFGCLYLFPSHNNSWLLAEMDSKGQLAIFTCCPEFKVRDLLWTTQR